MRSAYWVAISAALLSSHLQAGEGVWTTDEMLGNPIARYDGPNFGVIIGCDNGETFKLTTIADPTTFGSLVVTDQQLVLVVDGSEIARRAAWKEEDVSGLASFESYLPSRHMPALRAAKDEVLLIIGDPLSGDAATFAAKPDDLSASTSMLVEHCASLE